MVHGDLGARSEQSAQLMNPNTASKEEDVAGAIELWEEKSSRLARHGADYVLPAAYKKVALKKILIGKSKETFELWETEKLPFHELLKRTKDIARAKKLDADVSRGQSGINLGAAQAGAGQWGSPSEAPTKEGDVNAVSQRPPKWRKNCLLYTSDAADEL